MGIRNSESIQTGIRIKIPKYEHLEEKARKNPKNPHAHVATEINNLIDADFDKAQRKKKKK